jgi:hypothetical protein
MTTTTRDTAISGPPPVATRHDHQGVIVTSIERPGPELVAACRSLYTGLVLDHLGKHGCMAPDMKPVWSGAFLCGPAVTCLGADWRIVDEVEPALLVHEADVAGVQRAARDGALRLLGLLPVAGHDLGPARNELADLSGG